MGGLHTLTIRVLLEESGEYIPKYSLMIVHAVGLSASLPEMAHALSMALRGYWLVGRGERRDGKSMETSQIDE